MAFEQGTVSKRYLALVRGRVETELEVEQALVPARRNRMRVARAGEGGKPAHTRVRPLELYGDASLVEAEPITGRTHQIRVHLRHAGYPLLVDPQYGGPAQVTARDLGGDSHRILLARTPLHAARLGLPSLGGAPEMSIDAPLAQDMEQAIQLLRERTPSQS
jgi:tRNA pseudouridine32 synthase/23S rRNA pseudouridine746 synthase/23S rRNA pseudouridine955/2504/2580 synthase